MKHQTLFLAELGKAFICLLLILSNGSLSAKGQRYVGKDTMELIKSIPLGNIDGRFFSMDINLKDQVVFISAPKNNSIEIIDLANGKLLHSLKGINEPKLICYIPQSEEIFVTTGRLKCYFYSTRSFEKIATFRLMAVANAIKYDSSEKKIYIGYGENNMAIINAGTHKQTGFTLLPGPVEDIQLDKSIGRLYANMPEAYKTAIVDLKSFRAMQGWPSDYLLAKQMAIDTIQHRVFICYKKPPTLLIVNGKTGRKVSLNIKIGSIENLYYNSESKDIYVSGNGGVSIFHENDDGFRQIAIIKTPAGTRTSLFIPELNLYLMVKEARPKENAELLVYKIIKLKE